MRGVRIGSEVVYKVNDEYATVVNIINNEILIQFYDVAFTQWTTIEDLEVIKY